MKTAISIPDGLFKKAEETAKTMGIPRSRLVAFALEEFIRRHSAETVTERLDKVYGSQTGAAGAKAPSEDESSLFGLREATKDDAW